jgi:predicted RNA-binding protein
MDTPVLTEPTPGFTVLSFLPRPSGASVNQPAFLPHSVKRHFDSEVFTLDDLVTNGSQMVGRIKSFDYLNDKIFVETTWSGVGMNLDSLVKLHKLPSRFQFGDVVKIDLENFKIGRAWVIKVHFTKDKVQYDLELYLGAKSKTRLYNIDAAFVQPVED